MTGLLFDLALFSSGAVAGLVVRTCCRHMLRALGRLVDREDLTAVARCAGVWRGSR